MRIDRLIRALVEVFSMAGVSMGYLLMSRWLMGLGKPRDDWARFLRTIDRIQAALPRQLSTLRMRMLGIIGYTDWKWRRVRRKWQLGKYGRYAD